MEENQRRDPHPHEARDPQETSSPSEATPTGGAGGEGTPGRRRRRSRRGRGRKPGEVAGSPEGIPGESRPPRHEPRDAIRTIDVGGGRPAREHEARRPAHESEGRRGSSEHEARRPAHESEGRRGSSGHEARRPAHESEGRRGSSESEARRPAHESEGRRGSSAAPERTRPDPDGRRPAHDGERRHAAHEPDRRHGAPRGLALDPEMPRPDREPEIPLDRLDRDAVRVISRLRHMGHQAYFVGGCVRDLMLGRTPKDFDLATDAHPGEVRAIFRNCRLSGRRFRLAHVFFRDGKIIEVATFRQNPVDVGDDVPTDADLLITRDNVFGTAEEDARRRDFTVNGLFYDPFLGEVIDYVGGRADLEAHRISTIGDPEIRMREDPVRALRAVRFAARLGFTIEPEVFEAMRRHAGELARCAPPRVLEEIFKILRCTGAQRAFELLRSSGMLPVVLPSLSKALDGGGAEARTRFAAHLAALDGLVRAGEEASDAVLLGALLVHLHGGPEGEEGADALLAELVQTARLPRKMADRARMALRAQRLFHGPPRRRRRGGLSAQAYFDDALLLLRMTVRATGQGGEALARWEAESRGGQGGGGEEIDPSLLDEAAPVTDSPVPGPRARHAAPRPATDAPAAVAPEGAVEGAGSGPAAAEDTPEGEARRRRRRRGGRRRRRRGQGADGETPPTPPASPGAP
jgi:poly(A) polymerase